MAYKVIFSGTTVDQVTALIQQGLSLGLTNAQIQAMDLDFGGDDVDHGDDGKFSHQHYFRDLNYFVSAGPDSPEDDFYNQIIAFNQSYLGKADSPPPAIELLDALDLKVVIKRLLYSQENNASWAIRYFLGRLTGYPSHQRQVACGLIELLAATAAENTQAFKSKDKSRLYKADTELGAILNVLEVLAVSYTPNCLSNDMIAEIFHWLNGHRLQLEWAKISSAFRYHEAHPTDCVELAGTIKF